MKKEFKFRFQNKKGIEVQPYEQDKIAIEMVYNDDYKDFFNEGGHWVIPESVKKPFIRSPQKSSHGLFESIMKTVKPGKKVVGRHIAVKPYTPQVKKKKAKMVREFENILDAYEKGLSPVEPIGYILDHQGKHKSYLYTLAVQEAVPLSSINFKSFSEEKRMKIIKQTAKHLKKWHDAGLAHGDAKLKNIMLDLQKTRIKIPIKEIKGDLQSRLTDFEFGSGTHLFPIDLEKSVFMNKVNEERKVYDLMNLIGDSVHKKLIQNKEEMKMFLSYYSNQGNKLFRTIKKRVKEHKRDKNIANIKRVIE